MNFIKAAAIAISAVIACGAAEAKMPKEVNIVYVKAPFNLQNMVIKDQKLLEKAFAKDGVKVNWKTITSGAQQSQAMAAGSPRRCCLRTARGIRFRSRPVSRTRRKTSRSS